MKRFFVPATLFGIIGLSLSGCASMDLAECQTADWETIGYQDGAAGRPSEDISRHRKACAQHGVTPLLASYLDGWSDGVERYCVPQNGFNAGSAGRQYAGVCPAELEEDFLIAYSDGKQLNMFESNVQQISYRISRDLDRIERITKSIEKKEAKLVTADGTAAERVQLLADLRDLTEEKGQLEKSVLDLEHEHGRAEVELEHYRSDIAFQYGL